jgi:hypothetical protein
MCRDVPPFEIPDACVGMSHPVKFPMHMSGYHCPFLPMLYRKIVGSRVYDCLRHFVVKTNTVKLVHFRSLPFFDDERPDYIVTQCSALPKFYV